MITTLMLLMVLNGEYHAYEVESWAGDESPAECVQAAKQLAATRQGDDEIHCEIRNFL